MLSYETYKQNFHKFKLIRNFVSEDITEIIVSYAFAEIISNKTIIDSFRFCNFESMIETYTDNTARIHYEDSIEVSTEGLVQLLLEKGVLSDDEVDSILLEKTEHVGYYRTTTDGVDKQWGGGMA